MSIKQKPLKPSHERFAVEIAIGATAKAAYKAAYPGVGEKSSESCASRLLTNPRVQARINELIRAAASSSRRSEQRGREADRGY